MQRVRPLALEMWLGSLLQPIWLLEAKYRSKELPTADGVASYLELYLLLHSLCPFIFAALASFPCLLVHFMQTPCPVS